MLHHGPRLTATVRSTPLRLRRAISSAAPVGDVAVLGGGITGLATAYYLIKAQPHRRVTIYEASDRLGGWLSSTRVPVRGGSVLFEAGPRTLRSASNGALSVALIEELGLINDVIVTQNTAPAAINRYVYYPDRLVRLPHPKYGFLDIAWKLATEPVFEGAIWSGLREPTRPQRDPDVEDESIGDFISRRFSRPLVERLLTAVIHGIYAGDAWHLSAKSLFPRQWRNETSAGSILAGVYEDTRDGIEVPKRDRDFLTAMQETVLGPRLLTAFSNASVFTFRDGLSMLSDEMVRHLALSGNVEYQTSSAVESLVLSEDKSGIQVTTAEPSQPRTFAHVISALSPGHLNAIAYPPKQTAGSVTPLIPHIPTVTVMTVTMYFRTPELYPPGFGYLIPEAVPFENNPERALGVVFDGAYSPPPMRTPITESQRATLQVARNNGEVVYMDHSAWLSMPDPLCVQDFQESPGTKLTVMLGGHWWNGWPSYPDEKEGLALARSVLERHLGIKEEPEAWQVNLQKDCIPQYNVGHERRLLTARDNIKSRFGGRLKVVGNWIDGVGVNDCLRSGWEIARSMKIDADATGLDHVGSEEYRRVKMVPRR